MPVHGHIRSRKGAQIYVRLDCHQKAAHFDVVAGGLEKRPLLGSQFVEIVVNPLHAAVESEKFLRPDLSHALHSGHVVRSVAADCQIVNHLHGVVHAVFFADFRPVEQLALRTGLPRPELENPVRDKLPVVLVGSHHIDRKPFILSLLRHRPDDIVGLIFRNHQHRYVQRPANPAQGFQSVYHQLRSGAARPLVVRVGVVPECSPRRVERNREMCRMLLFDEFKEIFREPEKNRGVHAL